MADSFYATSRVKLFPGVGRCYHNKHSILCDPPFEAGISSAHDEEGELLMPRKIGWTGWRRRHRKPGDEMYLFRTGLSCRALSGGGFGHTGASASQIADAVSAGATLSTHLGNGAHPLLPKLRNYLWDQLAEDRLMAGFIVDGIHLSAAFVKAAIRAKGIDRSILITDAVAPAGCAPGRYWSAAQEVELTADQRVVIADQQRLAGSALRMDSGVGNLMKIAGLSLGDAVRMATTNAARGANVPHREAGLTAGARADLILFHFDSHAQQIEIDATYLAGRCVYNRSGMVAEATNVQRHPTATGI